MKLNVQVRVIVSLVLSIYVLDAAKIMMITFQQPSHVIMKLEIATDLIRRGHQVYFVLAADNPIAETVQKLGIHVISYQPASGVLNPYTPDFEDVIGAMIFSRTLVQEMLSQIVHEDCKTIMANHQLISHLKDMQFDIIVLEPFLVNPCYFLIPHELGVRYIMAIGIVSPLTLRIPALPSFTGFIPYGADYVKFPTLQTFADRFTNAANFAVFLNFIIPKLWADTSLMKMYAPEIDSWEDFMLRSEMILVENDHILDVAMPLAPHVVTIAGCTASSPLQPLPDQLETIMQQSGDEGVILASFGSTAHRFTPSCVAKFLAAFGRLRQNVVAKMTVPANTKVPGNVHLVKWLPQNDILNHPKIKLFITHCGSNSQYEALYHGVPMLGIPMFAEQGWNCGRAEHKGIALCLDLLTFTADQLYDYSVELIENATYRTNIRSLSEIRKDEPMNGCQKAGHWITHVTKYGSQHLRSPALDLSMFQFLMFDLLGVTFMIIVALISVSCISLWVCAKVLTTRLPRFKKHESQ